MQIYTRLAQYQTTLIDTPLSSLMDSIMSPKMMTSKGKGVGACSLVRNTSKVEGCAGVLEWELGGLTTKLIIHTDLHKPNNNLFSV